MTRALDRRSVVRGAAGLMGAALLAACGAEPVRRPAPSPLPLANVEPWGANVFLDLEDEGWKRRHSLEMLRAAGVRWIYQRIAWDAVETVGQDLFVNPQRRESSWERFDDIVDRAQDLGIAVVARVERSPQWARPGRDSPTAPPVDLADFAAFLRTLAARYKDRVQHYQIWHEPNLAANWGGAAPDPAAYAALLRVAYDALKSADDRTVVAGAQLAPTLENNPRAISDLTFLRQTYDHGAAETLDVQAAAAFGMQYSPSTPADPRVLNFRRRRADPQSHGGIRPQRRSRLAQRLRLERRAARPRSLAGHLAPCGRGTAGGVDRRRRPLRLARMALDRGLRHLVLPPVLRGSRA